MVNNKNLDPELDPEPDPDPEDRLITDPPDPHPEY